MRTARCGFRPSPQAARQAFTQLPDLEVPGEEDGTITPAGPLGSQYAVALGGRFLGYATDLDQASALLHHAMEVHQYWPDILVRHRPRQPPPPGTPPP